MSGINLLQLDPVLPVEITAKDLPRGMVPCNHRGSCIAWWWDEESFQWLVVLDQTGETVWVPQHEIRLQPNWSSGRRRSLPPTRATNQEKSDG